ncbi:sensor histidine kinase, partial [[Kitasatospora] papulosa]|uniref:sensor histidine kinase n=1 Tax=[Kitasatospora] papulosa TaxID=1464011 RepID=UPI0036B094D0
MSRSKVHDTWVTALQGLLLAVTALVGGVLLLVLTAVSLALLPIGIGLFTTPVVLAAVRAHATSRRRLAAAWSGQDIPSPYRPLPANARQGVAGCVRRCRAMLKDPATWRDVGWLVLDSTAGFAVALSPALLTVYGAHGVLLVFGLWQPLADGDSTNWYTFVPVTGWGTAFLAALVGAGLLTLASRVNPALLRTYFRLLGPGPLLAPAAPAAASDAPGTDRIADGLREATDTLLVGARRAERAVREAVQTRRRGTGTGPAWDGASGTESAAAPAAVPTPVTPVDTAPVQDAVPRTRTVQAPSSADLVAGARRLAAAMSMPVTLDVVPLPGCDPVAEQAALRMVGEALGNAAQHAGAQRVWVRLTVREGLLRVTVQDNGRGGARLARPGGLARLERELAAIGGMLTVNSPDGGPTEIGTVIPWTVSAAAGGNKRTTPNRGAAPGAPRPPDGCSRARVRGGREGL